MWRRRRRRLGTATPLSPPSSPACGQIRPTRPTTGRNTAWVKEYYAAIAAHSEPGGYVNFASGDDQPRVVENYGSKYPRLLETKRRYDPDNLFHLNQNIQP